MKGLFNLATKIRDWTNDKTLQAYFYAASKLPEPKPEYIRLNGDYPFRHPIDSFTKKPEILVPVAIFSPGMLSENWFEVACTTALGIAVHEVFLKPKTIKEEVKYYGSAYGSRAFYTKPPNYEDKVPKLNDDLRVSGVLNYAYKTQGYFSDGLTTMILLSGAGLYITGVVLELSHSDGFQGTGLFDAFLVFGISQSVFERVQKRRYQAVKDGHWSVVAISSDDNDQGPDFDDFSPA